ncbi:hypothetical protein CLV49_2543 [Labedella gwakjiensis]|uniref:Uncharacterized protein n=1 Tax=Labedella gwakjiensis TaxID=390269 RepID=A0A2P8GY65_9MICO|nr:hypothetical protein [Labedella gwakjiensis]PSL38913.1 hypothetical protein CLV49_2543 [Labedella gwakjiensis]
MSAAREARKRWLAIAGIVLFLAVDILLVVLALRSMSPRDNGSGPPAEPVPVASSPMATPANTPTPSATPGVTVAAPTRVLTALNATVAWRAMTGACPATAANPELTTDAGATWTSTDLTTTTGVLALQRIVVTDADTATFLGSAEDCTPDAARTFVAGADFAEAPDQLDGTWYLAPVGSATMHAPGRDVAAPCASAVSVAPIDDSRAGVLCADGSAHITDDVAATWTSVDAPAGTVALTGTSNGLITASVGSNDCAGVLLTNIGLTGDSSPLGCVESSESPADLSGSTAIDWTDDSMWIWVGDRLLISTDQGATWT